MILLKSAISLPQYQAGSGKIARNAKTKPEDTMRLPKFFRALPAAAAVLSALPAPADGTGAALNPAQIQQRIQQYRTTQATVTVLTAAGQPLANAAVTARQTRHKFLFGCNAFRIDPANRTKAQADYQAAFAALLNYATLPFYWGGYEPRPGETKAASLQAMARWCADHGIRPKGHPLCWHQVQPRWIFDKDLDEVQRLQLGRITREVGGFKGLIDTWDVVNEAMVMPTFNKEPGPIPAWCRKIGRLEMIKRTFAAARAANPQATLVLNDYDTSPQCAEFIADCLAAGVTIDAIGIQSHQHLGYWGARQTWEVCERFARLGRPLHFTETTLLSGPPKQQFDWQGHYTDWVTTPEGEARQARLVAEFYTVLFSHPAVQAITWWDFSDDHAWLGAPAGLVRKDMSPKPAYERLRQLIKHDWWTEQVAATTDAAGRLSFRGFLGDYALETPAGTAAFALPQAGACTVTARLTAK